MSKISIALSLTLTLAAAQALAQPVLPPDNADANIAPGTTVYSTSVACVTSTTTYAMYNAAATGHDAHYLVPDGSRVCVQVASDTVTAALLVSDSPFPQIGDLAAASTSHDVDEPASIAGTTDGQGVAIVGPRVLYCERVNQRARSLAPGYRSGLCSAPVATARQRSAGDLIYASCLVDAECDDVGGTPASSTCHTTTNTINAEILSGLRTSGIVRVLRGAHLGFRCTGSATIHVSVIR